MDTVDTYLKKIGSERTYESESEVMQSETTGSDCSRLSIAKNVTTFTSW